MLYPLINSSIHVQGLLISSRAFIDSDNTTTTTTTTTTATTTPGLHNKIPPCKIFARVWVAQEAICSTAVAKTFQGLGPKRRES